MASEQELLQKNWHQTSNETLYWNNMANGRLFEINKQLLGLAAILIPLTGSIIVTDIQLNDVLKTLLSCALVFLFASVILGFIQIIIDANFFLKYSIHNATRAKIYHKNFKLNKTLTDAERQAESLSFPKESTGHIFLLLQGITISLGLLLIVGIVIPLLFLK